MLAIQLIDVAVQIHEIPENGRMLIFIDEKSGIQVAIPLPDEAVKQISKNLVGGKVEVVPAAALASLKQ